MLRFNQSFFQPVNPELTDQDKHNLTVLLDTIYSGAIVHYETIDDFDVCKQQLLDLLDYLVVLNDKLTIFHCYRDKVADLSSNLPLLDIHITLKAAKQSLENSLLLIQRRHQQVDLVAVNNHIVNACYAGAFSNLQAALSFFQSGVLAFFMNTLKANLVLQLAQQFMDKYYLVEHIGNEIHYANGLYNSLADSLGLAVREDAFIHEFNQEIKAAFGYWIEKKMTVSTFIDLLCTHITLPPELAITSIDEFKKIEDFFNFLGETERLSERYCHLYDTNDDGQLIPRDHFFERCLSLLMNILTEKKYIDYAFFQINEHRFLTNTQTIVKVDSQGDFHRLTEQEMIDLVTILHTPKFPIFLHSYYKVLLRQLPIGIVLEWFVSEPDLEKKAAYFDALLSKPSLDIDSIMMLCCHLEGITRSSKLADYVFERDYALSREHLDMLAIKVSQLKWDGFIEKAIANDNVIYINSLLAKHPLLITNAIRVHIPFFAVLKNAINVMTILPELGFDLTCKNTHGRNLAYFAAKFNNVSVLDLLDKFGVNLAIQDDFGWTPAMAAADNNSLQALEFLKEKNAGLDLKNALGQQIVHVATLKGHLSILEKWHDWQFDLNALDFFQRSPVHFAAMVGNGVIFKLLCQYQLPLTQPDIIGLTPVCHAVLANQVEIFAIMQECGVDLDKKNHAGFAPIHLAAELNHRLVIEELVRLKVNINAQDTEGRTPAMIAVCSYFNAIETLEYLKVLGADLSIPDNNGCQLSHIAAKRNSITILARLNDWGVDLTYPNSQGCSPLHLAAMNGHIDVVKLYHRAGLSLTTPDAQGITPLGYAKQFGHHELVTYFKIIRNMPVIGSFFASGLSSSSQDSEEDESYHEYSNTFLS